MDRFGAIAILIAVGCGDAASDAPTSTAPAPTTPPTTTPTPTDTPPTDTGDPPTLPDDTGEPTTELPPCDPALAITADPPLVPPFGLVALTPSGGTGQWRYSLAGDAAGSLAQSGFYLGPPAPGTTDRVVLTDDGCAGEASVELPAVPPLAVAPAAVSLRPGAGFTVDRSGGGGASTCALVADASGAALVGCTYTAGAADGLDVIAVSDPGTGETVDVLVTVAATATVELVGSERWYLPLGATLRPEVVGGSGVAAVSGGSGIVDVIDGAVVGIAPGAATLTVSDRYAGQPRPVQVEVLPPQVPPSVWYGPRTQQGRAWAGDIDGDGLDDAVYASVEIHAEAPFGGAVVVYAGTSTGLDPTPVWTHAGWLPSEFTGRSLAVADVDADGLLDLLVGADAADWTFNDVGEIRIFRGLPGAFFESEPSTTLRGLRGGDRAGSSVGACDVDGDGFTDVVAGAFLLEDLDIEAPPLDRGGLLVFRGGPSGPSPEPTVVRYGVVPVDGAFAPVAALRLGELGLATGDVDADGDCDVAVGAHLSRVDPDLVTGNYGFVALYHGSPVDVLSPEPVRLYANTLDSNAELGRELLLADLDGDGRDDLVVGATFLDGPAGGSTGWFGAFFAASDDGRPAVEPIPHTDADAWAYGHRSGDLLGRDLAAADRDGDGRLDLLVGDPVGQDLLDAAPNVGRVAVFSGVDLAAGGDFTEVEPADSFFGPLALNYFGQAVASLGDLGGDGVPDLFVLSGQTDALGVDVARPAYVDGATGVSTWLDVPGGASGHDHGRGLATFDADADGLDDLVVGSPEDGDATLGNTTGRAWVFSGDGSGGFAAAPWTVGAAPTFSSGDRWGQAALRADFDGDGVDDLVVAARTDSAPAAWGTATANPDECPRGVAVGGTGAIAVWRGGAAIDRAPDWVFFPPAANDNVWEIDAADVDGDGDDDVVIGSRTWDPDGVLALVRGRPDDPSPLTEVICDVEVWTSVELTSFLGDDVAALGDVDGDGCEEVAVSAPLEDLGVVNQGVVRVLWGAGGPGCPSTFAVSTLAPSVFNRQVGEALAGGGDVDGDGIPDLAVTSDALVDDGDNLGGVWLVSGAWLRAAPRLDAPPGAPFPVPASPTPLTAADAHYGVIGPSPTIDFGEAVALVPDAGSPGSHSLAVGAPDADFGGVFQAGGVWFTRWVDDPLGTGLPGLDPLPYALLVGETQAPRGRLGEVLAATDVDGAPALLVGAPRSSVDGLMVGGAYVAPL